MATTGVDAFLKIEEDANGLLNELTRLRGEIGSYGAARAALDEAASGVSELAGKLVGFGEQVTSLVNTLNRIGTRDFLEAQESAAKEVRALSEELRNFQNKFQADQAERIDSVLSNLTQLVEEKEKLFKETMSAANAASDKEFKSASDQISGLQKQISDLRKLVLGSLGGVLAAIVMLIAMLLKG